jgi:tetratricopeptide (TPR) repeat protein
MIVDLKNKQWLLFSLFPLLFWSVLLSNFNFFFLIMAIFGAIITGYKVASDEWFEGMDQIRKSNFVAFDTRFKKTMTNPIFQFLELSSIPYGVGSLVFFNFYMFYHMHEMPYYAWMLLFLTWATIFYGFFMLIFVPEHWETMKRGAAYGFYSDNKGYWIGRGCYFFEREKYEEAIQNFDKALELDPKFTSTLGLKGKTLMKMGKFDDAIQILDKALELDPKCIPALGYKGEALITMKKFEEAIKNYDKMLEIEPQNPKTWFNRGVSLVNLKRLKEAIENFDKALEFNPKYELARQARENILVELKKGNS